MLMLCVDIPTWGGCMRITIVNGSPRRRGATAKVLHAMQERAIVRWDAEVAYFDLGDYEMRYCDGCTSCYRTGRCHKDDGLEEVLDVLAASEGLVLGTPTYARDRKSTRLNSSHP